MMSGLKELFLNNLSFIRDLFKSMSWHREHRRNHFRVRSRGLFRQLHPPRKAHPSFPGRKVERKEPDAKESVSFSPYESYNLQTGERSYCGVPLPADAPPRPNGRVTWDNLKRGGYDARRTCRLCAVAEKPAA